MIKWQTIESAPKDGTLIIGALIWNGQIWRITDAKFSVIGWYTRNGEVCYWITHWIPIPKISNQ